MTALNYAPAAIRDLQRLRDFLRANNPDAARRASLAIRQGVSLLAEQPRIGRKVDGLPDEFREWLIDFGDGGYVARYRLSQDGVTILAIRHQKEAGL